MIRVAKQNGRLYIGFTIKTESVSQEQRKGIQHGCPFFVTLYNLFDIYFHIVNFSGKVIISL